MDKHALASVRQERDEYLAELVELREENARLQGPGSMEFRFLWLLQELERRFPDPEPFAAQGPEKRYLAAIDAALDTSTIRLSQLISERLAASHPLFHATLLVERIEDKGKLAIQMARACDVSVGQPDVDGRAVGEIIDARVERLLITALTNAAERVGK